MANAKEKSPTRNPLVVNGMNNVNLTASGSEIKVYDGFKTVSLPISKIQEFSLLPYTGTYTGGVEIVTAEPVTQMIYLGAGLSVATSGNLRMTLNDSQEYPYAELLGEYIAKNAKASTKK